ncbi:MAG: sensor histidine kinase [Stigonema ocellatum SAG 48.90 = DSM 106950]|nr:sensor histidine kinase [Stigonema ocellatum SAG 48.90 = DSM 106950]
MPQEFSSEISPPFLSVGSGRDLGIESTLQDLPLYNFRVEISCTGVEVAKFFEKYPLLPGAILVEEGKYIGMISRRRLSELLIRPHGQELFFHQPLGVLYSYVRTAILLLADTTPIMSAMQLTLRRSPELLAEPVVVQTALDTYKLLDIQELNIVSWQIRGIQTQVLYERSQAHLIQNDKMASLGRLVDGVAHEILDPVNFIWGNLTHVSNYSQDLIKLVAAYTQELGDASCEINNLKQDIEFDFLEQDLIKTLGSIRNGAERLKKLVVGLQNFCHIHEVYPKPADLQACLDNIILLINSRLRGEIEIVKNYGHLPPVYCFIGELYQVFMNILSQSVDALLNEKVRNQLNLESIQTSHKPRIEITTTVISQEATKTEALLSRWVSIRITDNGQEMSQNLQQEILESFSAGKPTAKETSLAVSYRIITARHGGKLNFRSQPGRGTEFEILLPLV